MSISSSYGQPDYDRADIQIWSDITLTYFKSHKLSFGGDAGLRFSVDNKDWGLFYLRPTLHYSINPKIRLSGGIASFNTLNKAIFNTYELRLFQDAQISWPDIKWVDFYHRFRFEQRFFFYDKIENDISIRGRYLIGVKTANFNLLGKKKKFYVETMWEAFIPFGEGSAERFVNNQRWYVALVYNPSERLRYEIFYIWQKSRRFFEDGFKTTENIIRFRIFYMKKLKTTTNKI